MPPRWGSKRQSYSVPEPLSLPLSIEPCLALGTLTRCAEIYKAITSLVRGSHKVLPNMLVLPTTTCPQLPPLGTVSFQVLSAPAGVGYSRLECYVDNCSQECIGVLPCGTDHSLLCMPSRAHRVLKAAGVGSGHKASSADGHSRFLRSVQQPG